MTLFEWYLARASGIVAFVLLTIAVVLGLTLSGRAKLRYWPRFAIEDVHRFAGLLTGTFVSIHVLTLFADSYLPFSLTQLAVPGPRATGRSQPRSASSPRSFCSHSRSPTGTGQSSHTASGAARTT